MPNTNTPVKRFKLWQGIVCASDIALTDHDQLQLHKLICGRFSSVDYEHLHFDGVQSIRCSDERRILFTNTMVEDKCYLKIERVLAHHEYDAYIRHAKAQQLSRNKTFTITNAEDILELEIKKKSETVFVPIDQAITLAHYNQSVLALNDEQINAGNPLNLPCLIEGAAGAGKTLTLFILLSRLIEQLIEQDHIPDKPILVITSKPSLTDVLRSQWFTEHNPLSRSQAGNKVIFLSEDAFYDQYSPMSAAGKTRLTTETFLDILRSTLANTPLHQTKRLDDYSLLHEFQIMATCHDIDEYLQLGERESYLAAESARQERRALYQAFKSVLDTLEATKAYSPFIATWKTSTAFYAVLHDEVQTGYLPTKFLMRQMAENSRYLLCGHSAQTTDKKLSVRATLIKKLGINQESLQTHLLSLSYRNPFLVSYFDEFINQLRRNACGGALDKSEAQQQLSPEQLSEHRGKLAYIARKDLNKHLELFPANNIDTVIITRPEFIDEAIQRFGTGFVVTPANFGGQERKRVYLYRLTECKPATEVNALFEHFDPTRQANINLPKAGKANPAFNLLFTELYTGCSRAEEELYVVESPDHKRRFLLKHLENKIISLNEKYPQNRVDETPRTETTTPPETWLTQIDKLLADNDVTTAKQIWRVNLNRSEADFQTTYFKQKTSDVVVKNTKRAAPDVKPKSFYELLESQNPPTTRQLTAERNGVIILHEMLLQDEKQFTDYFTRKPALLLALTADDWVRISTRSQFREHYQPSSLLSLVLHNLSVDVIPDFLIKVFAKNNYALFYHIKFDDFVGKNYICERFPEGATLIQLLLASDNALTTERPANLACFYLTKHKQDPLFMKHDKFWYYDHFNLWLKKNRAIVNFFGIEIDRFLIQTIETSFANKNAHQVLVRDIEPNLYVYEFLLLIEDISETLLSYIKLFKTDKTPQVDSKQHLVDAIIQFFSTRVSFTHITHVKGIRAPFLFHLLLRKKSRALLAEIIHTVFNHLLFDRQKKGTITLALLNAPYAAKPSLPHTQPETTTCLRLLANVETIPLFIETILTMKGALEVCLADNNFLFDAKIMVNGLPVSILYLIYRYSMTEENQSAFHVLIKKNNYLLLKTAPTNFMNTLADSAPRTLYGHLLLQDENFDFIDHYYHAVKAMMTEKEFAGLLFTFLFETEKLTNLGYIPTFLALARSHHGYARLKKMIAFAAKHYPVAQAIARCLSMPLDTSKTSNDVEHYLWNGLATLLSDVLRRELLYDLVNTYPNIPALIADDAWSHPNHPDRLLRVFMQTNEGNAFFTKHIEDYRTLALRMSRAAPVPTSSYNLSTPTDIADALKNIANYETIIIYATVDPIGFFFTREDISIDSLLSSPINACEPLILEIAQKASQLFLMIIRYLSVITTELPLSLWFPINSAYYPLCLMSVVAKYDDSENIWLEAISVNRYQLVNQLSLIELNTPVIEEKNEHHGFCTYSILDFLLTRIECHQNTVFSEMITQKLQTGMDADTFLDFLSQGNYADAANLGVNSLYLTCRSPVIIETVLNYLATATPKQLDLFAEILTFTPTYYDKQDKSKKPWSPLALLATQAPANLQLLFTAHPELIAKIPITAWSSPLFTKDNYILIQLKKNLTMSALYELIIAQSDALKQADINVTRYIALENTLRAAALPSQLGQFSQPSSSSEVPPCPPTQKPV